MLPNRHFPDSFVIKPLLTFFCPLKIDRVASRWTATAVTNSLGTVRLFVRLHHFRDRNRKAVLHNNDFASTNEAIIDAEIDWIAHVLS